ncbi:MAG: Flp pilus assembly complex ATPase component TadA, partial [Bacilli bacterium]|nr:Flp pilus assembly complex ATPase component TadA [Bacilli bacterium]
MKNKSQENNIKHIINKELASAFKAKRILKKEVLEEALNYAIVQDVRLDLYLIKEGFISEEVAASVIAKYLDFEYANIDVIKYNNEIVSKLTYEFIEKNKFISLLYDVNENKYTIALADPFDAESIRKVYAIFGVNTRIIIAPLSKIKKIASRVHSKLSQDEAINEYDKEASVTNNAIDDGNFEGADLFDSPAVKLVESTLKGAIAVDASDIHIEPYEEVVRIRYRIDGKLLESTSFNVKMYPAVSTRIKILAGLDIAEKRLPQDGRISMIVNNIDYDFRVSTLPTINGEKIVIRILDQTAFEFKIENLGFIDSELPTIKNFIKRPHGIVLLTGPTGCGKSTTLYSFIKDINDESVNIITVEDPVEYSIDGVNQVQINPK